MANLDEIKKRLQRVQSKGGDQKRYVNNKDRLLTLEPGNTVVRAVPYKENKDNPFIELYFHYNINNRSYLSPISYGNPDPFVEFAEKLRATGLQEDRELAYKLMPKIRIFLPVVVRGKEQEGVKFWGFSKTTFAELVKYMEDPDYGDYTDVMTGRDIVIEKTAKQSGSDYGSISFRIKPKETKLAESKEDIVKILNNQIPISDVYSEIEYDVMKETLENWLSIENGDESESQKQLSSTNSTSSKEITTQHEAKEDVKPDTKIDDISSAFDDLFGANDDLPF